MPRVLPLRVAAFPTPIHRFGVVVFLARRRAERGKKEVVIYKFDAFWTGY